MFAVMVMVMVMVMDSRLAREGKGRLERGLLRGDSARRICILTGKKVLALKLVS